MKALLVDVGNSRIKWRVDEPDAGTAADPDRADAIATADAESLSSHWDPVADEVDVAFVSNVAGDAIEAAVTRALRARWPSIRIEAVVPARMRHGLVNRYAEPTRLGPDRWLAMIGALALRPDRTLLVCSFGTATTIDLVTAPASPGDAATFVGGMILPGPDAMGRALARETARLPARGGSAVGFAIDTDGAIDAGIAAAQAGAVERAYREARTLSPDADPRCLVTGGAAARVAPLLRDPYELAPHLVLRGLAIVARAGCVGTRIDVDAAA